MNTVRISPVEVQIGVVIYQFLNADLADGFFALACEGTDAHDSSGKYPALRSRPVDCDHEIGSRYE